MISPENLEKIKEISLDFFQRIEADAQITIEVSGDRSVQVSLMIEKPQMLIGDRGTILAEVQHLLKAILRRSVDEDFYVDLDINDYKKKKNEYLKQLSESLAEEVALTKKEKILPPMSAYERRIVHLVLVDYEGIMTESTGEGLQRRVIIRVQL